MRKNYWTLLNFDFKKETAKPKRAPAAAKTIPQRESLL